MREGGGGRPEREGKEPSRFLNEHLGVLLKAVSEGGGITADQAPADYDHVGGRQRSVIEEGGRHAA